MTSLPRRFNLFQRLLHWLMAACIIAMLFIGVGMVSTITPKYLPLILAHKTLGATLLVLVLIRLALRLFYGAPPLPADLPTTDEIRSETISPCAVWPDDRHAACLVWGCSGPRPIRWSCTAAIRIPALLPQSDTVHTVLWNAHFYLGFAFFALVLLHIAAGLYHALIRRDGVFETIAPLPLRDNATPAE